MARLTSLSKGSGACNKWALGSGITAFVFVLAGLLSGLLVPIYVDDALTTILVCDQLSAGYDSFKNSRDANTKTYVTNILYNITNAQDFILGTASAEVVESMQYMYRKQSRKFDIEFGSFDAEGYETVKYKTWDQYTFDPELSCAGCTESDQYNTMSIPYSGILTSVVSEAGFLLQVECTAAQRAAIGTATPVCADNERNTATDCACCTPVGGGCAAMLQPEITTGSAILSYLARLDRGVKVRDGATAFGDTNGVYSPLIVTKSVREILLGHASAVAGFAVGSAATDRTSYDLTIVDDFTTDYGNVCSTLCPAVVTSAAESCDAVIPATNAELADLGFTDEEVQRYSYLRQMSCSSFPWAALSRFYVFANATTGAECVDSTKDPATEFCCLWTGAIGTQSTKGFGCISEVGGGLNERMLDTLDEARTFTAGTDLYVRELRTGCGEKMNSNEKADRETQTIVTYKTKSENTVWLSINPSGAGVMTQADVYAATNNPALESFKIKLPVEGAYGAGVYPKGLSADFFSTDVSDGKPLSKEFKVFPVTTRRGLNFKFDKQVTVNGVKGAKFKFDYSQLTDNTENNAVGQGEPYAGLVAGYFYYGSSALIHEPNFAYGDHYLLTQNNNSNHETVDTTGVVITQTLADYINFTPLDTPRTLTSALLTEYENDESLLAYVVVEPATGNYIEGHNRIGSSFSIWECDARVSSLSGACATMAGSGQCYTSLGTTFPCSAANVLTPMVHGGKVIPVAFTDEHATISNDDADALAAAGEVVFFARVFMTVVCGLGLILAAFSAYSYLVTPQPSDNTNSKHKSMDVGVPNELAKLYHTESL